MRPPREQLGFAELVVDTLGSQLHARGFQVAKSTPTIVVFVSSVVFVNVFHGRKSFEIGCEIGQLAGEGAQDRESFSLSEVIRLGDPEAGRKYRQQVARTRDELRSVLEYLAKTLSAYGDRALKGERGFFDELRGQRRVWSENYSREIIAGQTRPKAEEAFRKGRYAEAASLYSAIEERLTKAEKQKLSIARRRSSA